MPELPEVEHFRQILMPLICSTKTTASMDAIKLECPPPSPTKRFPVTCIFDAINKGCYVMTDVLRKGKVLCVILQKHRMIPDKRLTSTKTKDGRMKTEQHFTVDQSSQECMKLTGRESTLYLSLHMGMTGRISSPNIVPNLESLSSNDTYPPPHTHLVIHSNGKQAAFSDPRRFGSVLVHVGGNGTSCRNGNIPTFDNIAPDALETSEAYISTKKSTPKAIDQSVELPMILAGLMNKKKGTKSLLLDQRAVVSGIGNWVADELLYRCRIHPDQSFLNMDEANLLVNEMQFILSTAIACLREGNDFPKEWLFHCRWRNGGGKGTVVAKDFFGNSISFVQSGGRSTAVVPSIQKLEARKFASEKTKTNDTMMDGKKSENDRMQALSTDKALSTRRSKRLKR